MNKQSKGIWTWKKKRIAIIAAALLLVLAAGYTVFIAPMLQQEKWIYKETVVERGTITVGVVESGALEYGITAINYDLDLSVDDEDSDDDDSSEEDEEASQKYLKIEEVYVSSGQRISEGTKLLKLTEDSVSDVRRLLQSALTDAQVAYNEAEAEYELSALEAKTDYDVKGVSKSYASTIYQNAKSSIGNDISSMQTQINQRTANISSLEEKVETAREAYEEALKAYESAKEGMESTGLENADIFLTMQTQYLNAQSRYQAAKAALEQAEEKLKENAEQIEKLTSQIKVASAKSFIEALEVEQNYQESIINGDNARIIYNAKIEELKEDLQEAEQDKEKIEKQLEAFEAFVGEDGILYADGIGIVTQVAYEKGDSLINAGTMIAYASPEDMTISVDVTQEDVVALTVGDKVDITFNAYEDTVYEGSILSIDTTATSRNSNTISYTVVIGVSGDTKLLYGGMTADITFVTEEKEDVLYISKKALVEQNDKTYVYIKTALGGMELKEIQIGISNGTSVEVVSGLEEGDTIYIASRISSEAEIEGTSQQESNAEKSDTAEEGAQGSVQNEIRGGMEQGFDGSDMPNDLGGMRGGSDGNGREARP